MRRYTLDVLKGIVELAGDLGVPGVVIGPGKANPLFPAPKDRLIDYFFTALDELCPRADKAGTELWVENMPFAFLPKIGELMDVLDRYGNPRIGIVWDAANSHFAHEDLAAIATPMPRQAEARAFIGYQPMAVPPRCRGSWHRAIC